jgi:HK97 family phage major capsid protein
VPYAEPKVRASSWTAEDYSTRLAELRSEWAELSEKDRTSDDYNTAKKSLMEERSDLDFEYRIVRQQSGSFLPSEVEMQRRNAGVALMQPGGTEFRSAGEHVLNDDAIKAWLARPSGRSPEVELRGRFTEQWMTNWQGDYEVRTLAESSASSGLLLPVGQPFLPTQAVDRRKLFIRDLIAGGTTTLTSIPYVRELNAATNETAASTVAEGATKPEATIEFVDDDAPVRTIAVLLPITNQLLADSPAVVSYINGRLSYMLAFREEAEILNGNGIAPDLKGILRYNIQTQSATAGEIAQTLGNAIAKIEEKNGYPNGVAMSPSNYWSMVTNRETGTIFDAGTPFSSTAMTVWGLPIVKTRALETNHALVADFRLGAQVFDRSPATTVYFDQHSDYAAKNKTLIRAEERLALAVYREDWFVDVTLSP